MLAQTLIVLALSLCSCNSKFLFDLAHQSQNLDLIFIFLLQNGTILVFDIRLTRHPLQSIGGLTVQSIHTIHSLVHNPTLGHDAQKLLAASSLGPCVWSAGSGERLANFNLRSHF